MTEPLPHELLSDEDAGAEWSGEGRDRLTARAQAAADLNELQRLSAVELLGLAQAQAIEVLPNLDRAELLHAILAHRLAKHGLGWTEGVLETLADGFGFLRSQRDDFEPGIHDVYVSPSQIRRLNLKPGHLIAGPVRPPRRGEKFFALLHVDSIDGGDVASLRTRVPFAARTPILPTERLHLDRMGAGALLRAIDLLTPWGKGQRVMVAAPPGSGRTRLLTDAAAALLANHDELRVVLCLLDERPEEMTAIRRRFAGDDRATVLASTFDQPPSRHVALAEMALARCQRMVEAGRDVVLLLDSLTALTRAYHLELGFSGRLLCPGLDAAAIVRPKKLFGAARKCEEGGSLTILATALTGTGSRIDEAIAEEFCNRGNADVAFDAELVQRHADLPLDALRTATRREDLLLDRAQIGALQRLRERLGNLSASARTTLLAELLATHADNRTLLGAL
ncbi:MAG: hypothetical protein RL398_3205 [Planctomycetota bacterium]|jgi:transcription termination factor Rho